jgi:hypothetical protein
MWLRGNTRTNLANRDRLPKICFAAPTRRLLLALSFTVRGPLRSSASIGWFGSYRG